MCDFLNCITHAYIHCDYEFKLYGSGPLMFKGCGAKMCIMHTDITIDRGALECSEPNIGKHACYQCITKLNGAYLR